MQLTDVINSVVTHLSSLPDGTEISTSEVIEHLYGQKMQEGECNINGYDLCFDDFFTIDTEVLKKATKQGLVLDRSKYDDMVVGLPYNIPYVIMRKAKKHD